MFLEKSGNMATISYAKIEIFGLFCPLFLQQYSQKCNIRILKLHACCVNMVRKNNTLTFTVFFHLIFQMARFLCCLQNHCIRRKKTDQIIPKIWDFFFLKSSHLSFPQKMLMLLSHGRFFTVGNKIITQKLVFRWLPFPRKIL